MIKNVIVKTNVRLSFFIATRGEGSQGELAQG